jgi:hypothetical protein
MGKYHVLGASPTFNDLLSAALCQDPTHGGRPIFVSLSLFPLACVCRLPGKPRCAPWSSWAVPGTSLLSTSTCTHVYPCGLHPFPVLCLHVTSGFVPSAPEYVPSRRLYSVLRTFGPPFPVCADVYARDLRGSPSFYLTCTHAG